MEDETMEDINTISSAYDSFLSIFPLCHWHLDKYANQKAKMCGPQEAVNIYERGVGMAMYSVGFWVDYFTFAAASFGNPEDVRR
ncbi:pre-mRNA-processing factor 39 [Phtheirospermum japonicum]|uniref:Pre-mRNA-processing factor 39 n=1 Tax=Phtheirospermum japonicum TaxID=374723 RepID=A0A830C5I6_9LAMI|nr:pre-mRNA-processing factor 39 [Phtheirospermum japonicum]